MGHEIDQGLREQLAALAHVMENRCVIGHRLDEIDSFKYLFEVTQKPSLNSSTSRREGIGVAPVVVDIFKARRGDDEIRSCLLPVARKSA